jgi:uncharacterized protein (TIGR00255 family)
MTTLKSMTGFGQGEATTPHGKLVVELRAVNHRYLEVRVRASRDVNDVTGYVEQLARERLSRGRIDINIRLEAAASQSSVLLDVDRARAAYRALTTLRDELAPNEPVPLSLLASVPDLFSLSIERDGERVRAAAHAAFLRAVESLHAMRVVEGAALAADLVARLATVRVWLDAIAARVPLLMRGYDLRLRARLARVLGEDPPIDAARLEQEIAMLVDRSDVSEELTRSASHCGQFDALMASTDACGRKLDFLLQEMSREVNTVGSKAQDAEVAHAVVELKAELERMREQVQNVE